MKRGPTFEVRKGEGQPYVVEIAPNGEIVSTSEQYASRWNAARSAKKRAAAVPGGCWRYAGGVSQLAGDPPAAAHPGVSQ